MQTTLMRAINNSQVDGFPPKSQLTTVYLESDIDPSLVDVPVADFPFKDPALASECKLCVLALVVADCLHRPAPCTV